jgi:multiple sugar transport system ATP-binding protein
MKIVLEHISKRYPNRDKKVGGVFTAVDDFDLTIPDGKLVGLLGPSGCGKSTTLNMICGLETPTEGKIWFGDTDVTTLTPELRGVGMVFQSYALYPHMTVRQNIMFPLENFKGADKLSKEEMLRRVEEAAGLVQISELPGSEELSVGEKVMLDLGNGQPLQVVVSARDEATITFDANHEMAGKDLNFHIELVEVQ